MKMDIFTVGLNVDEEGTCTPVIHFNSELEEHSDLETLQECLGEENTIKLAEIAIEFINNVKGFK